jgi:hypothetical protein
MLFGDVVVGEISDFYEKKKICILALLGYLLLGPLYVHAMSFLSLLAAQAYHALVCSFSRS